MIGLYFYLSDSNVLIILNKFCGWVWGTCFGIWVVKSKRMHEMYWNTPYQINLILYLSLVSLVSLIVSDCNFPYFLIF